MQYFPEIEDKIKPLDALLPLLKRARQQGKTIVSNNGSYDILHLGHLLGLAEAKAQGDILVVGVNSDKSVSRYKGCHRPINDEVMRARMLAGMMSVDFVFLFDDTEPMAWLSAIKPDVHTNGAEYGTDCIEREVVEANGGRLHLLSMTEGYKTTRIIQRIMQAERE